MAGNELPPAPSGPYGNRHGFETTPKQRRSPNLPLTVLITIYIVALLTGIVLYVVALGELADNPLGAAGVLAWASGLAGLGILGGMLHLAIAAIRHAIEDNSQ